MQPTPEDFEEWRENPVSQWVFEQMRGHAECQKDMWAAMAWEMQDVSEDLLKEARVRADCYVEIPDSTYEDWIALDDSKN